MTNASVAFEYDFVSRQERSIPVERVRSACDEGKCCWVDIDLAASAAPAMPAQGTAGDRETAHSTGSGQAATVLRGLGVNEVAIENVMGPPEDGRHDVYDDCLHLGLAGAAFIDNRLCSQHVEMVIGERFVVTLRRGSIEFVEHARRGAQQDFARFAQSLGFVLYEFWDHLTENYCKVLRALEDRVEQVQRSIFDAVDDGIFSDVAGVTHDLLEFRKHVVSAREVLHELAVRRSPFVSESTQPYLGNLVGRLERLAADLAVEREVLASALNLYLGMVSHRTNRVVNRLTVISAVFLPLTFLCGVYGMNFQRLPELRWTYGYLYFWALAMVIAGGMLVLAKVKRWL